VEILIAPWGNPKGWRETTYKYKGRQIRSKTSLKILQEVIKPDRTIIIGLDTLAEKGEKYKEVKANVEEEIKKYANEFGLSNYEVLIAPGIGTFQNGVFRGEALDYYYYIIAKISLKLLENPENLNIHLDLTHGINYSTILTYKAIKEIIEVFSIFNKVEFRAYNADPSLPTIIDKLSINRIEDITPTPTPFAEKISQGKPLKPKNSDHEESLSLEERRELFEKELKCVKEVNKSEISAFIGALYNGLPLALFTFYPKKDKLRKIVLQVLKTYEKYTEVKKRNSKLEVTRKIKFEKDFKIYVLAYVIATLLDKLISASPRKKEVTLNEIKYLNENLFKFDNRLKMRIDIDIHNIKKDIEGKEAKNWQIYNKLLGKPIGEPDARNFLAHSGFERNVIEVKRKDNDILIRYRQNKIKTIRDLCQRGLR